MFEHQEFIFGDYFLSSHDFYSKSCIVMTRRNLILVIAGPSVPAPREEGACINEPIEERLHGLERETKKHEEKVQKKVSRDF